ncbi:ATP-binding protein [Hymenobacter weizhouensis]|uniref:ATP-binding protein n=1 Tax=Hymenobacter sp. YIM 151500-1 TaxID=2987689 RepID=UPI0022265207|nr:ATP-binding protein [Hymenobacter sp. YIM 151500-1]UYZ63006.1 ATP-binding protein [Hymenobacter sp. YIM 151500-1]
MLRVALTGPESTGKSTLSRRLAAHYRTAWAPEYARQYLEERGPRYTLPDLEEIARGQLRHEAAAEQEARHRGRPVVFFDTDLLVIQIWAEHAFGECPAWIARHVQEHRYDLTLLLHVDVPWEPDPLREHPHQRDYFFRLYQQRLHELGGPVAEISGPPAQRLAQAVAAVEGVMGW